MHIRLSTKNEVSDIMNIIDDAKNLLASLKIDQWQNGYPNKAQIIGDIDNKESYVLVNNNNTIVATAMFTLRKEPTYKIIHDGQWILNEVLPYGVIHRMAVKKEFRSKGLAKFMFDKFHNILHKKNINSLKIDTHQDNLGMQNLLKKMGYQYCGIIYTSYDAKRLAFEKIV